MRSNSFSADWAVRICIFLVFCLHSMTIIAQQDEIKSQGSDPLQGKQPVDSTTIRELLDKSESLQFTNPDSAIVVARQAIRLSDDAGYEIGKAEGFNTIGGVYYYQSEFAKAADNFNLALKVYEKEGDTKGISQIQNNLGSVYADLGDAPKALDFYLKSLRNAQAVNDAKRIGTAHMNLGTIYQNEEATYPQAIENYEMAIEFFGQIDYPEGLAGTQLNFGEWYVDIGDPEKALPYLEEALNGFKEIGYPIAFPLNVLGKAYFELDQFEVAKEYYNQTLEASAQDPIPGEEAEAYYRLGLINLKFENTNAAIRDFNSALQLAEKTGILESQAESYNGLSKAYALKNDFNSAYEAQQKYADLMDSLKSTDYAEKMSTLRVSFGLESAEKENELLKAQNKLNELQIEEDARTQQLLLIILGLFLAIIAGFVFQFFYIRRTNKRLAFERNRSDQILLNILPKETADELKENGFVKTRELEQVTVLFTDFKAFSTIAERISAEDLIRSVDYYFKNFDEITERYNLEKIKTIGDSYMCAGGLPNPNKTHAQDAFGAALEIRRFVLDTELNPPKGIYPFKIRIGLNSGPVVSGVVGTRKFAYDIWGNTVNIAARMESGSIPGRINVSENTYKLLKEDYEFTYRGEIEVKNGMMLKMYFAEVPNGRTA